MLAILAAISQSSVQLGNEPTLALTLSQLRGIVGRYLGYTRTSSSWTSDQLEDIDEAIRSGLRRFYHPDLDGFPGYVWSFMRPVTTVTTVAGDSDYDLPGDFGGMEEPITYPSSDAFTEIYLTSENDIRRRQQSVSVGGRPRYGAVRPKAHSGNPGQRWELLLWPAPDGAYTLTYQYFVLPNAISGDGMYPYGGMAHAETIKAACLCAAAGEFNDQRGDKYQEFRERLAASLKYDLAAFTPRRFGYNGDPGRGEHMSWYDVRTQNAVPDLSSIT